MHPSLILVGILPIDGAESYIASHIFEVEIQLSEPVLHPFCGDRLEGSKVA
jgi:hypothetical protein